MAIENCRSAEVGHKICPRLREAARGPSIDDVTQILGGFGPPPPLVTHFGLIIVLNPRNLPYYVMFWTTPLPPLERDVIYGWSLTLE